MPIAPNHPQLGRGRSGGCPCSRTRRNKRSARSGSMSVGHRRPDLLHREPFLAAMVIMVPGLSRRHTNGHQHRAPEGETKPTAASTAAGAVLLDTRNSSDCWQPRRQAFKQSWRRWIMLHLQDGAPEKRSLMRLTSLDQGAQPCTELQERGRVQQLLLSVDSQPLNSILHSGSLPMTGSLPARKQRGSTPRKDPKNSCPPFWITLESKWQPATSLE